MDAFNADPMVAIDASAQELNGLSTDQWDPDLAKLDAVVASLQIEGMTGGMLVQPGPMTLAECEPGSLYNAFISSLLFINDTAILVITRDNPTDDGRRGRRSKWSGRCRDPGRRRRCPCPLDLFGRLRNYGGRPGRRSEPPG